MAPRTLIFEDDEATRFLLASLLRRRGHEVLDFSSPVFCPLYKKSDCGCSLKNACADMLITDMRMPRVTGLEFLRLLLEKGCRIPRESLLLVSSDLKKEEMEECRELGVTFLSKPFSLNDFQGWVAACEKRIDKNRKLMDLQHLLNESRAAG